MLKCIIGALFLVVKIKFLKKLKRKREREMSCMEARRKVIKALDKSALHEYNNPSGQLKHTNASVLELVDRHV